MHEIGIVRQILRTVEEVAGENDIDHVDAVVVDCGELSLIVPEYLEEVFPAVTKGTVLEGSELIIEPVPGMARCIRCEEVFSVIEHRGYCPGCGSFDKEILTGREFRVREIMYRDSSPFLIE